MGVNSVTSQGWQIHTQQVCLFDPVNGALRAITIPFHLALRYTLIHKKMNFNIKKDIMQVRTDVSILFVGQ